jgi:outer membrane receptor protein involved in Fe transport
MTRIFTRLGFTAAALVAGSGIVAHAQGTQSASITGKVVNTSGAGLSGVKVTISSPALQQQRTVVTGKDGSFRAPLLPPGDYRLVFVKEGLQTMTLNQHMGLGQDFSPSMVMSETPQVTVVVTASEVTADKADFKVSTNYTKEVVDALPINRNSALDLAYLTPGVQPNINQDKGAVTIRGAQGTGNLTLVDGQNVADNLYNGQRIKISFDSVEETQILTGAIPAEYGNIEGGVINQITKIGGNDFSGTLRWDVHNNGWNAVRPMQVRSAFGNQELDERSFSLGGPIVKDHLWFYASYYDTHPTMNYDFSGDVNPPAIVNFSTPEQDYRHEIKLTFAPNTNNSFTASYNNSSDGYLRDGAGAGEIASLSPFVNKGEFGGLSWSSILSDSLTLFLRAGFKTQTFGNNGPGSAYTNGILYNYQDGFTAFGAPAWDSADPQPDDRRNQTFNGKLSWFFEGAGSHQLDIGFDYYKGTTKASGYQSNGRVSIPGVGNNLNLWDAVSYTYDPTTQMGIWDDRVAEMDVMKYVPDQLTVVTEALFVNDKWNLNKNFSFNLGLRVDTYDAKNQSVGKIANNASFSPRLGAKYDLFGDNKLVFGLSWNRYNGRPLETVFGNAGYSNNPIQYSFFDGGTVTRGSSHPAAFFFDPSHYDTSLAPNTFVYTNAALNVRVDPKLKQQQVDETQASATWNFETPGSGTGFLRGVAVYKKWNNLVGLEAGNHGQVKDPVTGSTLDILYWTNDPDATRSYKDLELDGAWKGSGWSASANFTWSEARGNFIGEGRSQPGAGFTTSGLQGTNWYSTANGVRVYDPNTLNPSQTLDGGLTINALAAKSFDNAYGKLDLGLSYFHKSGAPYYESRSVSLASNYPGAATDANIKPTTTYAQYRGDRHEYNSQTDLALSLQQNFTVMKVAEHKVNMFMKVAIDNIFNHQQVVSWSTAMAGATLTSDAWAPRSGSWGSPTGYTNYQPARSFLLSAGIKF